MVALRMPDDRLGSKSGTVCGRVGVAFGEALSAHVGVRAADT